MDVEMTKKIAFEYDTVSLSRPRMVEEWERYWADGFVIERLGTSIQM